MGGRIKIRLWPTCLSFFFPNALCAAAPDFGFSYFEFASIITIIILVYVGSLIDFKRRTRKKFSDLISLFERHPEGWCLWRGYEAYESSKQFHRIFDYINAESFSLSDLLIHLEGESARHLEAAFRDLIQKDYSFSLRIKCGHRNSTYLIKGTCLENEKIFVTWVRDITEQVHSQKILYEGLARTEKLLGSLENILNEVPFPAWHRTPELMLDYCNKAYQSAVQTESQEVIEKQIELLPKGQGHILAQDALRENTPQHFKTSIIVEEECKICDAWEIPDKNQNGTIGFAIDIDDLEKLREEKETLVHAYHEILSQLSMAVSIYDEDRKLAYYNHAYVKMNNLDESVLKEKPRFEDVLEILREKRAIPEYANFPAYKKQSIKQFHEVMEIQEELIHLPDERTLRMFTAPYPMGGLIFMYEDVTNHLSLERKNNVLSTVQRATLDNLFEGVVVFGSDNLLTLTNSSFRRIWNLSEDQCYFGQHFSHIVDLIRPCFSREKEWEDLKNYIIENATNRSPQQGEILRADGGVIAFNYVPLPNGERLLSYKDITSSHRIEEALRIRNEALESADRIKSEFVSNISHELRTPLTTIIEFSEILQNCHFGKLNGRQEDYVKGVLDSSTNLLKLINDILDLSSIEAGSMAIESTEFCVNDLIQEIVEFVGKNLETHKLTLTFACRPEIMSWAGDEKRLRQALLNLINNAIHFTPQKGKIMVCAEIKKQELVISVADTGIGISQKDQERVFEKFEKGPPLRRTPSGAGLGLALVKNIIELHGGRVELSSELKRGTTITCYLPKSGLLSQGRAGTPEVVEYSK